MIKPKPKKVAIFDLDDTLIFSEAKIKIYDSESNNVLVSLTPSQFNYHVKGHGQYMSFDDFECEKILGNSKINRRLFSSLKGYIERGVETSIVTARGNKKIVVDFFKSKGVNIKSSMIYAIHDPQTPFHGSISERKKQAIQKIIKKGYNDIIFYDDNLENLRAAEELRSDSVKIKIIHVLDAKKKTEKRSNSRG
jgi:hypothetical protein